jgi:hypothetical protein
MREGEIAATRANDAIPGAWRSRKSVRDVFENSIHTTEGTDKISPLVPGYVHLAVDLNPRP